MTEKDEEVLQYLDNISAGPLKPYVPPEAAAKEDAEAAAAEEGAQVPDQIEHVA